MSGWGQSLPMRSACFYERRMFSLLPESDS